MDPSRWGETPKAPARGPSIRRSSSKACSSPDPRVTTLTPVPALVLAIPTELSGGRYAAPAWAILTLGGVVVASAAVYLGVRWRKGRDKR